MDMLYTLLLLLLGFTHLNASLFSTPPHQGVIPQNWKYDHILSANEEFRSQIVDYVQEFPFEKYDIYYVPEVGLFFLDRIHDWIKDQLKNEIKWEPYMEPYIYQYAKPGTIAVDIGAHIGTQTLLMARAVGPQGKVIAFEPQLKFFRELFLNVEVNRAPNVYCFWGAISDKEGIIQLPNFNFACEVVNLFDFTHGYSGFDAPAVTLDSLKLDNVSLIKIDVDGLEDIVLDGVKQTILSNKPIVLLEIQGGWNLDSAPPEIVAKILHTKGKLEALGYTVHRIHIHDFIGIPD